MDHLPSIVFPAMSLRGTTANSCDFSDFSVPSSVTNEYGATVTPLLSPCQEFFKAPIRPLLPQKIGGLPAPKSRRCPAEFEDFNPAPPLPPQEHEPLRLHDGSDKLRRAVMIDVRQQIIRHVASQGAGPPFLVKTPCLPAQTRNDALIVSSKIRKEIPGSRDICVHDDRPG